MEEPGWEAALTRPDTPRSRRPLTRAERLVVVGSLLDTALLAAFVPVAHLAGLGAVWLVLLPSYTLLPLLLLLAGALVRGRGRVPAVVWAAFGGLALGCLLLALLVAAG